MIDKNSKTPYLTQLQNAISGTLSEEWGQSILTFSNDIGHGTITIGEKDDALNSAIIDMLLSQDINLDIDTPNESSITFLYCLQGNMSLEFDDRAEIYEVDVQRTLVIKSDKDHRASIFIKGGQPTLFNFITITQSQYNAFVSQSVHGEMPLDHLFFKLEKAAIFYHVSAHNYNLESTLMQILNDTNENDVVNQFQNSGRQRLIFSYFWEQFMADAKHLENTSNLQHSELERISVLSQYIHNKPEVQYTIQHLCSLSSLSPAKLQHGFRYVHNRTVADFIRSVRLNKAEQLLRTTDLNISEIVYSIGLTSRSYFCKIFKEKYQCTPREYRNELLPVASAVSTAK